MTLVQPTKAFVSFSCSQLKTANVLFILSYFCAVPNTEELAMQPPYGLNLFLQLGTDQRRLRHQSLAHLEARQSPRRSITLSAGINTDQMRREAAQHTPTHDAGGQHTHTRTWHGGARCTVAQVRRPFALPLQSTRHGESSGAVLLQPPTGPSYKRRRTQGAPGRRAVAATAPSSFPGRTAAGRRRRSSSAPTGRPTPPELGTRLPIHSSAGAALRAYHLARSLYATVLPTSIHGDHV